MRVACPYCKAEVDIEAPAELTCAACLAVLRVCWDDGSPPAPQPTLLAGRELPSAFDTTVGDVLLRPGTFYRVPPREGDLKDATLFAAKCMAIFSVAGTIGAATTYARPASVGAFVAFPFVAAASAATAVIIGLLMTVAAAGVLHAYFFKNFGRRVSFETTLRTAAFAHASLLPGAVVIPLAMLFGRGFQSSATLMCMVYAAILHLTAQRIVRT